MSTGAIIDCHNIIRYILSLMLSMDEVSWDSEEMLYSLSQCFPGCPIPISFVIFFRTVP